MVQRIVHTEIIEPFVSDDEWGVPPRAATHGEIKEVIRRVVSNQWKDALFSYGEMDEYLATQNTVLPKDEDERYELYDELVDQIWHEQKDVARRFGSVLPTLFRLERENELYQGIVRPIPAADVTNGMSPVVGIERVSDDGEQVSGSESVMMERIIRILMAGEQGASFARDSLAEMTEIPNNNDEKMFVRAMELLMDNGMIDARTGQDERGKRRVTYGLSDGVKEELQEIEQDSGLTDMITVLCEPQVSTKETQAA